MQISNNNNVSFGTAVHVSFPVKPNLTSWVPTELAKSFAIKKGLIKDADAISTDYYLHTTGALVADGDDKTIYETAHNAYEAAIAKSNSQNNYIERAVEMLKSKAEAKWVESKNPEKLEKLIAKLEELQSKDYNFYRANVPYGIREGLKKVSSSLMKANQDEYLVAKKQYIGALSDIVNKDSTIRVDWKESPTVIKASTRQS